MSKFKGKSFGGSQAQSDNAPEKDANKYKMCYVDADTILYRSATFAQEDYIEVTHIKSGRIKEFKNVTEFRGRSVKKEGGWLLEINESMRAKKKPIFSLEDFKVVAKSRLNSDHETVEDAIKNSLDSIGFVVGDIKKFMDSEDYRLVISAGKGNYRDQEAKTIGYKSSRGQKPIYFSEIRKAFTEQYKSKIIEVENAEAEDLLGWVANAEQARVGDNFSNWAICISYIDKDVDQVYAPSFSYDKLEEGWRLPTKLECSKCLVAQSIAGDPTDTINGIPTLTEQVTKQFGLRKANGCGKTTAENLIADCISERDMWLRACYAYQSYYGKDIHKFKDCHGEEQAWTWLDYLQETYILVKMQSHKREVPHIQDKLGYLGIDVGIDFSQLFTEPADYSDISVAVTELEKSVNMLAREVSLYKTLNKPDLIKKLNNIVVIKEKLYNNISLLK